MNFIHFIKFIIFGGGFGEFNRATYTFGFKFLAFMGGKKEKRKQRNH